MAVQTLAALNVGAHLSIATCAAVRVTREGCLLGHGRSRLRALWKLNSGSMPLGCSGASGAGGRVSEARHATIGEWKAKGSQP